MNLHNSKGTREKYHGKQNENPFSKFTWALHCRKQSVPTLESSFLPSPNPKKNIQFFNPTKSKIHFRSQHHHPHTDGMWEIRRPASKCKVMRPAQQRAHTIHQQIRYQASPPKFMRPVHVPTTAHMPKALRHESRSSQHRRTKAHVPHTQRLQNLQADQFTHACACVDLREILHAAQSSFFCSSCANLFGEHSRFESPSEGCGEKRATANSMRVCEVTDKQTHIAPNQHNTKKHEQNTETRQKHHTQTLRTHSVPTQLPKSHTTRSEDRPNPATRHHNQDFSANFPCLPYMA